MESGCVEQVNDLVADEVQLLGSGNSSSERANGDVNQQSFPQLVQLPEPPDPPGGHVSSMVLRDCGRAGSSMEHFLTIEKQYISQKVSTSSKASISNKAPDSLTCSDWRRISR